MPIETFPWDPARHLTTPEARAAHLAAALEGGDPRLVAAAVEDVARAEGGSDNVVITPLPHSAFDA